MLECIAPNWVSYLVEWLKTGQIDVNMFDKAVEWLIQKGIIICSNTV